MRYHVFRLSFGIICCKACDHDKLIQRSRCTVSWKSSSHRITRVELVLITIAYVSEGDDHAVLDRWDRRATTTFVLFLSVLIPALHFRDVGLVLALTGTVAATSLTYLLPGLLFIGVHGEEFLALAERSWGCLSTDHFTMYDCITWYILLMPFWIGVARTGKRCLAFHREKKALQTPAQTFRLGRIKHKLSLTRQPNSSDQVSLSSPMTAEPDSAKTHYGSVPSSVEEEDPQEEHQTAADFFVAIGFVTFGIVALASGLLSIFWSMLVKLD